DPDLPPTLEAPAAPGEVPLTPIQEWFFELDLGEAHHFNQALLLELRKPIETDRLRKAFRRLFSHHDAFRLRFRKEAGRFRQELVAHGDEPPFSVEPIDSLANLQASLDLENGPVARAALIPSPSGGPDRLLFVCHHLIVDGVSWRILVSDLDRLLTDPDAVLPITTSFASWARRLRDHAESEVIQGELPFWHDREKALGAPLPRDHAGLPTYASLERVTYQLNEEETEALLRPGLESILLRALGEALSTWAGQRNLRVAVEGHGREEILEGVDLSRTVGWFTSMYPVVLDGAPDRKEIPTRGIGYGLLRYQLRAPELRGPRPEVSFTYLGQLDSMFGGESLFRMSAESPGPTQSSSGTRSHLLDVTARIQDRRLSFHWYFSRSVHERTTIERLARSAADALRSVLARLEQIQDIEDRYALTPMQRGMLFESFYQPDAGVYVEQYGLELEGMGEVDGEALVAAWQRVVDRHAALRTSIVGTDSEEPQQMVWRSAVLPVLEHDLRSRSESEQEAWLEEYRNEDRKRGIDLGSAPLMRLTLFRRSEKRLECLWTFHH
ncbi:MAG: condensation domain-containing protein, partial [Vicinamibacteria bacterium]